MEDIRERRSRILLSRDAMLRLYERAHRLSIQRGGQFEPLGGGIVIWTASPFCDSAKAEAVGPFCVRWGPQPIIWKLQWAESAGATETDVRRAIVLLIGPDEFREEEDDSLPSRVPKRPKPPPRFLAEEDE